MYVNEIQQEEADMSSIESEEEDRGEKSSDSDDLIEREAHYAKALAPIPDICRAHLTAQSNMTKVICNDHVTGVPQELTHRHRGQEEEAKNLIALLDQVIRNTTRMNLGIYSNQMKKKLKEGSGDRGPTNKNRKAEVYHGEGPTDRLDYDLRGWEPEEYEYLR
ncbi:hypothetical protein BY996DRAFT_6464968, partial [Phakopsora pachyrhizi]